MFSIEPRRQAETDLIDGFVTWAEEQGKVVPEWAIDQHNFALRWISSYQRDYQRTWDALMNWAEWADGNSDRLVNDYEKLKPLIEKGILYGYGRDKFQRPIIYFNFKKFS